MNESEFRKDLVSGEWVLVAPGRAKRPGDLLKQRPPRTRVSLESCPFEDPQTSGNAMPLAVYEKGVAANLSSWHAGDPWDIQILRNKYPAVTYRDVAFAPLTHGPYAVLPGFGFHELLITRDHDASFAHLSNNTARNVWTAFAERYRAIAEKGTLAYISFFHNWGPSAGASVYHPHYQIIALPIIPPDVHRSLEGSSEYFKANGSCVHCAMIAWERTEGTRIIFENEHAIVFAPFVSREPFELRIFPTTHQAYFEETSPEAYRGIAEALQEVLLRVETKLADPDYNFFLHTAPLRYREKYAHYHWHLEIVPKVSVAAGFELGTGIEITMVDPDDAARILHRDYDA